jgi:hypothetical protein
VCISRTVKIYCPIYIIAEIIHTVIQYYVLDFVSELMVERMGYIASDVGTFMMSNYSTNYTCQDERKGSGNLRGKSRCKVSWSSKVHESVSRENLPAMPD